MALSDEEQRLLEQLEASLAKDDPKLAHTLRGTRPHVPQTAGSTIVGGLGFVGGLGLLVAGIALHWSISVVGFVVMVAAAVIAFGAWRPQRGDSHDDHDAPFRDDPEQATSSAFIDRLEERFRHRDDDDR